MRKAQTVSSKPNHPKYMLIIVKGRKKRERTRREKITTLIYY